jgi:hypothetical protein
MQGPASEQVLIDAGISGAHPTRASTAWRGFISSGLCSQDNRIRGAVSGHRLRACRCAIDARIPIGDKAPAILRL